MGEEDSSSLWDGIRDTVAGAAPAIGSLIGGPAGGAVGSIVASALGVDNDAKAIDEALKTDPEALAKVKQAQEEAEQQA